MEDEIKLMEEKLIIESCLNGESEVYEMLVTKYQSSVLALALSVAANLDDAKDIAQESFVKGFLKLSGFKAN